MNANLARLVKSRACKNFRQSECEDISMDGPHKNKVLIGVTFHTSLGFHEKLARELKERGYEVHLVSSEGSVLRKLSDVVNTHQLEMARQPSVLKDIVSLFKWVKLLREVEPDVVLAGTPKASLLGMLSSKFLGIKARIYWVHGLRLETAGGMGRRVLYVTERLTAGASTAMYAVSPSLKKKLSDMGIAKPDKITVLGAGSTQGVNLRQFYPPHSRGQRDEFLNDIGLNPALFTIGFVGRLGKEKGVDEFKDALLRLHSMGEAFQVLILGSVEDDSGQFLLDGLMGAGIKFVAAGHVEDTAPYFRSMDLFCLPTYREGLGNVVLEAFATKLPVISTEVTGIVDLVRNGETGLLIPARNSDFLVREILRIMRDPDLATSLGANALKFVSENYDSELVIANQISYMEHILDEIREKA